VSYEHHIPALIRQFKQHHSSAIAHLLCDLLMQQLPETPAVHCIMPTPMHWQRNLQRGNNHASLLAKHLSRATGIPLDGQTLTRPRIATAQKQLSAAQRKHNLLQAFQCQRPVHGKRIALVDDVMTTGSTMEAMSRALLQAGASEVHCWVIARTPKH
jgi:ComF family protein